MSIGNNRNSILDALARNRDQIRNFGVRQLGLFGSAARGECTDVSDLDFLVEFEKPTFDAYMDLKLFLEDLFARHVDLVLAHTLKPRLRDPILREAVHVPGL